MRNKFRHHLLHLSLLVLSGTATAQAPINHITSIIANPSDNRVTQLEHIVNAHKHLLMQLQQQIAYNHRYLDTMRSQIQATQHQLAQIIKQQKPIYQQIDNLSIQTSTTPTDYSNQSLVPIGNVDNNPAANNEYNKAVALVLEKKQYKKAISALQNFIRLYPHSGYKPNANYWLGQLNYNHGKKEHALYYFALVAKTYPQSPKAPDALFKVGVIIQDQGQQDEAQAVYQQVQKLYPSAYAAKQAQKRLAALVW